MFFNTSGEKLQFDLSNFINEGTLQIAGAYGNIGYSILEAKILIIARQDTKMNGVSSVR